ncbi:hypothetical protein MKX01_034084, partial [Papaver californicum]
MFVYDLLKKIVQFMEAFFSFSMDATDPINNPTYQGKVVGCVITIQHADFIKNFSKSSIIKYISTL